MIKDVLSASAFIKDNQEIVTKYESARLLATDEVGKNLKKIDDVKMLGKILENAKNAQKD